MFKMVHKSLTTSSGTIFFKNNGQIYFLFLLWVNRVKFRPFYIMKKPCYYSIIFVNSKLCHYKIVLDIN